MNRTKTADAYSTTGTGKRYESIDIARGIAMICIMLGHLGIEDINRVVFTFDLPIFYFVSGFFLSEKGTLQNFARKKVRTCLVPYYFTCLCITILSVPFAVVKHENVGDTVLRWIIASLYAAGDDAMVPVCHYGIGAIWFLWAIFWGTLIVRIVIPMRPWKRMLIIAAVFSICEVSWKMFWLPLSLQAGGTAAFFIYLGWVFRQVWPELKKIKGPDILTVFWLLIACIWLYDVAHFRGFWLVHCEINNGIIDIAGSICGSALLLLLSWLIYHNRNVFILEWLTCFLSWVGRNSLLFLCGHIIELSLFPWHRAFEMLTGRPDVAPVDLSYVLFEIAGKSAWIICWMCFVLHNSGLRKVYECHSSAGGCLHS